MIIELIDIILTLILGMAIGYAWATKDSLMAIENVNNWICSTQSNDWVQYRLYEELEEKYERLLEEYNQYQGTIKALRDSYD